VADLPDGTGMFAALADEGIDLVHDPIVFKENGEERAHQPKCPAPAPPDSAEGGVLHGKVHEISGAVTGVRQQCQNDEEK